MMSEVRLTFRRLIKVNENIKWKRIIKNIFYFVITLK